MKERIAVIGCGVIAAHYRCALEESHPFALVAVCDRDESCVGRGAYEGVPFYTSLDAMLAEARPTVVLVSTPSTTHYEVVRDLLERGLSVIVEKPMASTVAEIEALYALADARGVHLACMFHWVRADEVVFLREYLSSHRMESVDVCIRDNYTEQGAENTRVIKPSRLGLRGAWTDSGINVLSYLAELLPMREVTLLREERQTDPASGYDCYTHRVYRMDGTEVSITIDWRGEDREKYSTIRTEDGVLRISHNRQQVVLTDARGETMLFSSPTEDRLASHYRNYLHDFTWREDEQAHTLALHRILTDSMG